VNFLIIANDSPANPEAGTRLHEQTLTVTNGTAAGPDPVEVDATAPVMLGPGVIWLMVQAPPPVLIAADWDGMDVEWRYHGSLSNSSRPNIYIRGAVR